MHSPLRVSSRLLAAGALALACTPAVEPVPAGPVASADAPAVDVRLPAVESKAAEPFDCEAGIGEYLERRAALNTCTKDEDCAEIWPGLCPHGPFYVDRAGALAPLFALARRIDERCTLPSCEPPMALGIASCVKGRCAKGRTPPRASATKPCWDREEIALAPDGGHNAETATGVTGTTPHLVVAPADPGVLRLVVDWPRDCSDCKLLVSEHTSGMASLVDTTPARSEDAEVNGRATRRDHIELRVTPGPYHIVATAGAAVPYHLRSELRDATGKPGRVTQHGTSWVRECEG